MLKHKLHSYATVIASSKTVSDPLLVKSVDVLTYEKFPFYNDVNS